MRIEKAGSELSRRRDNSDPSRRIDNYGTY